MKKKRKSKPQDSAYKDIKRLMAYMDFATRLKIAQQERNKKDCNK